VGNCRTVGRPSGACPLWAGQLSTERCSGPLLCWNGDSYETWDSLRVLGGWTGVLKVDPHDYSARGFLADQRKSSLQGGEVEVSQPGDPTRRNRPRPERAPSAALCFAASRAPCSHPASRIDGARQHERPTGPLLASPMPCGYAGSIATGSAVAGLRIRRSSWICGGSGCNVARRNEKPAERRALRKPWC